MARTKGKQGVGDGGAKSVWHLAIDPASYSCGISLWHNREFVAGTTLVGIKGDSWTVRVRSMNGQLSEFLSEKMGRFSDNSIDLVFTEVVKNKHVSLVSGALSIVEGIDGKVIFVSPSSWKAFARRNGAKDKDPKGIKSLQEMGWKKELTSEDEADSIMIYMAWRAKNDESKVS